MLVFDLHSWISNLIVTPNLFIVFFFIYTITINTDIAYSWSSILSTVIVQFHFLFLLLDRFNPLGSKPRVWKARMENLLWPMIHTSFSRPSGNKQWCIVWRSLLIICLYFLLAGHCFTFLFFWFFFFCVKSSVSFM